MLTNEEKLEYKEILAKSIGISINDVEANYHDIGERVFCITYKGYDLITGFYKIPTIEEARARIKNLYLCGVELDFNEEMKTI